MSLARRYMEQAAQYVADNPDRFDFWRPTIPRRLGHGGCALGFIGYFANEAHRQTQGFFARLFSRRRHQSLEDVAQSLGYYNAMDFYRAMSYATDGWEWRYSATICAEGMRKLAQEVA